MRDYRYGTEKKVVKYNEKLELNTTLTVGGLRDVPLRIRPKFEKFIEETFPEGEGDTPVSFAYSFGSFFYEGKIYLHLLEVCFLYWDGYRLCEEYVNFLA